MHFNIQIKPATKHSDRGSDNQESVTVTSSRTVIKNVNPMQLDSIHISTRKEQLYTYFERASGVDCVRLILPLSAI